MRVVWQRCSDTSRRWIAPLAVSLVAACGSEPPLSPEASSQVGSPESGRSHASRAALAAGPLGLDREFHEIAGRIPGFAGFYLDPDGTMNVLLVDRTKGEQARAEARQFLEQQHGMLLGPTRVVDARYSFRQLYAWRTKIANANLASAMTGLGICEEKNQVCVGARRGGGLNVIRDVLARLGIPEDAVTVVERDPIQPMKTLIDRFNPVPAGVVIDDICTLGFNAYSGLKRVLVTAAHCTIEFGSREPADVFGQPDDGNRRIGVESYDPPMFACAGYTRCRYSDAAEITYYDSVSWRHGRIARPYPASTTIDPVRPEFIITGEGGRPLRGQRLSRVGITTGLKSGYVQDTCFDHESPSSQGPIMLLCQSSIEVEIQPGDSGGPVFAILGNEAVLYGIAHTGGDLGMWFSSIENIQFYDGFGDYDVIARDIP